MSSSTIAANHQLQNNAFQLDGVASVDKIDGLQQRSPSSQSRVTVGCMPEPMSVSGTAIATSSKIPGISTADKINNISTQSSMPLHRSSTPSSMSLSTTGAPLASTVFTNNYIQRPPGSLSLPPPSSISLNNSNTSSSSMATTQQPQTINVSWPPPTSQQPHQHHPAQLQYPTNQTPPVQSSQPIQVAINSSSLPYQLAMNSSTQPMRIVAQPTRMKITASNPQQSTNATTATITTTATTTTKSASSGGGRGNRGGSNRPPPGAVNLERSYQICQAVIQNSPNRHQLKAQLRPPPSMLATPNAPLPTTAAAAAAAATATTNNLSMNAQLRKESGAVNDGTGKSVRVRFLYNSRICPHFVKKKSSQINFPYNCFSSSSS